MNSLYPRSGVCSEPVYPFPRSIDNAPSFAIQTVPKHEWDFNSFRPNQLLVPTLKYVHNTDELVTSVVVPLGCIPYTRSGECRDEDECNEGGSDCQDIHA